MLKIKSFLAIFVAFFCLTQTIPSLSFELSPLPTKSERHMAKRSVGIKFKSTFPIVQFALHKFSSPVHETLTQLSYDCEPDFDACNDVDLDFANSGIVAGVRWNDDPPFEFTKDQGRYTGCDGRITISFSLATTCWLNHFKDVSEKSEDNPNTYTSGSGTLLARTHFGDLQFLHSMANTIYVPPTSTKEKIMMWAQFTWRIQSRLSDRIRPTTKMGAIPINGFVEHFPSNEERTVENLFTLGRPWLRHQLGDIAFGSLIHMVEDSFSGGHAERISNTDNTCDIPEIVEFHTYAGQNKSEHKEQDSVSNAKNKLILVGVIKQLISMRDNSSTWEEVAPYFENCIFKLSSYARNSSSSVSN